MRDPYDDFVDDDPADQTYTRYKEMRRNFLSAAQKAALQHPLNEVGVVPPITPEIEEKRRYYEQNYVDMHQDLFPRSTGIKPFGPIQIESVKRTHHVLTHGGRSVIAEPRGFGKTTRTANNALMAVLQGKVKYALILASSVQKAEDILESIKTELIDNEQVAELYPAVAACFQHVGETPNRAPRQTYNGKRTFIGSTKHAIRMPIIPGEASSGSVIQVRTKDNVRGLAVKVRYGEESGKVLRPDFVFMDDIQTDEEADSPTSVWKIVQTIKKSILFSGSHSKRISAVMCCTPICPGDVSSHFILNEPSWDCVVSKMVPKMPSRLELWLTEYAKILLDFDRNETGSRLQAQLRARKYVEENYDLLHEGAEVAWDWAYGWSEDPQTEVSALHHAMNFLIMEGQDAFESECQCNVQPRIEETAGIRSTIDEILNKVHEWPRYKCPVECEFVATHIDVNKNVHTYATIASPRDFRPHLIDYGEWPRQEGATWKKRDIVYSLKRQYPDIREDHELIYQGVKDLINTLGKRTYQRDDGLVMHNNLIVVDMSWSIDEVQRGIRDSEYRSISMCYRGQGIRAKDKPFMNRHYEKGSQKHFHCATVPTTDRQLTVLYTDVNYFKTLFHKGIATRPGIGSSFTLFTPERPGGHLLFAKHCVAEIPEEEYYDKEDRRVIVWQDPKGEDRDNEYFDNAVGAIAALFKLGVQLRTTKSKRGTFSIQDYINKQKEKR